MEIKAMELLGCINKLSELYNKKLPVKLGYAIAKNRKALMAEYEIFEEQRKKVFEQNCLKDENGQPIPDPNNKYQYANADDERKAYMDYSELAETKVNIAITEVNYDVVEKCDNGDYDTLTVAEIEILDFMIK